MDRGDAQGDLNTADPEIGRHFPTALAGVLEAQNQHRKTVEGEAPDDTEGVRFAQGVDVSATRENRKQLQADNKIDDAVAGSEAAVRLAEPIGEHAVFRHAVQYAVRTDDGGVHGAGENEESDEDDKDLEDQLEDVRAGQIDAPCR